ncbi:hypothetical protein AM493_08965 [Flavobacterium akiainvivens]|uniref:Uncharacterized protein n=1 Tax=Flavobacterium akiainvivens TaxID=1202724 RepID=A0A0M8MIB8_9FLAO|nr:hypothetical protein [Flavobacterium akiainvivens]KOS06148.1 hypothetical protein AM493_08965 [Flavobacterium akiainvivens]SFQ67930.1 hypothetical protein SAMN05444144_11427 [Flavobacterium akiainvivens]
MKLISSLLFLISALAHAQDGSDIRYYNIEKADSTLVGKDVHFDFFNRSFGGKIIDTLTITINNKPIRFIEVRKDNGHNNWFSQQGMVAIDKIDNRLIRINKCKIDSIDTDYFYVTLFVDFCDDSLKAIERNRQMQYKFGKKDVVQVLVKSGT